MGYYYKVYNLDKKEQLNPVKFGDGLKLPEIINGDAGGVATAIFYLLSNKWNGDRIVVVGDGYKPPFITTAYMKGHDGLQYPFDSFEGTPLVDFVDISEKVKAELSYEIIYQTVYFTEDVPTVIRKKRWP